MITLTITFQSQRRLTRQSIWLEKNLLKWTAAKHIFLCKWRTNSVFNFGGRTFAFKRLAQGLSRSPTAFSSCVSNHLQSCIANDICFVYFDDLGSGAEDGTNLIKNLEHVVVCIQNSGFKLRKNVSLVSGDLNS